MGKRRSVDIGKTVLYLDDLITDPVAAPIIDEIRDRLHRIPSAVRDQMDAAIAETRSLPARWGAAGLLEGYHDVQPGEHPAWVRLGALEALMTWAVGGGSVCMHDPTAQRPQPVYAVAWKPGLVVCARCPHLTRLPERRERDLTCDGCGRVTQGAHTEVPLWTSMVQLGVLHYGFAVCADCKYWP